MITFVNLFFSLTTIALTNDVALKDIMELYIFFCNYVTGFNYLELKGKGKKTYFSILVKCQTSSLRDLLSATLVRLIAIAGRYSYNRLFLESVLEHRDCGSPMFFVLRALDLRYDPAMVRSN